MGDVNPPPPHHAACKRKTLTEKIGMRGGGSTPPIPPIGHLGFLDNHTGKRRFVGKFLALRLPAIQVAVGVFAPWAGETTQKVYQPKQFSPLGVMFIPDILQCYSFRCFPTNRPRERGIQPTKQAQNFGSVRNANAKEPRQNDITNYFSFAMVRNDTQSTVRAVLG